MNKCSNYSSYRELLCLTGDVWAQQGLCWFHCGPSDSVA